MPDNQPSLLILSGVQGDPRRYRTFHLYEQARLAGINVQLSHVTDLELRQKVTRSSIVIIHRAPFDAQIAWIEKTVHQNGGVMILDLDDLIFDPDAVKYIHSPDFTDPIRHSLYQEDVRLCRKTLELCDYVITSGEYLAGRVRELGRPAAVHRNAFSQEMLAFSERAFLSHKTSTNRIVIGYASGTPTHDQDFSLVIPALQSVLIRHSNVELWLVGRLELAMDWGGYESQIKMINFVPWRKLPDIQAQFDINIAPLRIDNPFGQSKSEIKYVEAALLRVPTVASPSDSYQEAIRPGDNGYLANDVKEWVQYLEALIEKPELRISTGNNAYQDVLEHYHPTVRAQQFVNTLNLIIGNRFEQQFTYLPTPSADQESAQVDWSTVDLERSPNFIQRGIYTLKYRNIRTLIKLIWIFIRRLVSPIFPFRNQA